MTYVKQPVISVIVPVYKVEAYLDRCIVSILNSTFKDFELILVDDGSPDKCPQICDEWAIKDNRIKVIHQENMGLSGARNTGIKIALGEYITFIDSDDWITDDMLENLLVLIKKYNSDIAMCNMIRAKDIKEVIKNSKNSVAIYSQKDFLDIMFRVKGNRCVHYACGKLYKKTVLRKEDHFPVGLLNEDVEGMFKSVLNAKRIVETDKVGYYYFYNEDSITGAAFGNNFLSLTIVWQRMFDIASKEAPEYLDKVIYNQKRTSFTILCDMILFGNSDTDQKYDNQKRILLKKLRYDFVYLLNSPMQPLRKIVMALMCLNYDLLKSIVRYYIKFKRRLA